MRRERYTLKNQWGVGDGGWHSVSFTPMFPSEEECSAYYNRNKGFIDRQVDNRELAIFKIVTEEAIVKEL